MALYLLNRQPQAREHIYKGGIREVTKKGESYVEPVNVTPKDVEKILATLTTKQKRIAEGISKFFTDVTAEWGNEVSMQLWGYKKFTVENYFPIVSDKNYLSTEYGTPTDTTLINGGSAKARTQGANNPIFVEDVFDVFSRQADFMGSYNAFVVPIAQMKKVLNYRGNGASVKSVLERKCGKAAEGYIAELIKDICNA